MKLTWCDVSVILVVLGAIGYFGYGSSKEFFQSCKVCKEQRKIPK
jgi:hypothetical protein